MQEFKYLKYENAEIINIDGNIFEYHRLKTNADITGAYETGRVFNQKTKKHFGDIIKFSSYITLTVLSTESEYSDIDVKSAIKQALA